MPTRVRRLARRHLSAPFKRTRPAAQPAPPPASDPAAGEPRREALVRGLERGRRLDGALVAQVHKLNAAGEPHAGQALAESLRRHPETRALGHLAGGIIAYRQGYFGLAHAELREVPPEQRARLAALEYVRAGLRVAPEETLREIRALVADDPPSVGPKSWFEILAAVYGYGAANVAREVYALFDRHVRDKPRGWRGGAPHRDWLRTWIAATPDSPTAPSAPGRRTFAVMDYGHPGANRASANIGDHIQSVAALGHLVRHRGVRLHGEADLVALLERLGERTRPERAVEDASADLEVMTVHRDASMYQPIPEGTWVLCFGWYMHALFGMRHGFPLHDNLRPIFVSFHCNKRELLTPDAVEYLKRYGPVGCRDWTTVYLLLSIGVPAFFSGCLTTTIDTVFPAIEGPGPDAPVAYVDADPAEVPARGVTYGHSSEAVRTRSFTANVDAAVELLETYRGRHSRVVTSRLHCYLPVRSLGMDVDFRPANRSDVRFEGLLDIGNGEFDAIRSRLNGRLERVFAAILGGAPEDDVYALWRELNARDVAMAEERRREGHPLPAVREEIRAQVRAAVAATTTHGPAVADPVHCAVVMRRGGWRALAVLVASLLEHASRPLHVWVLAQPGTGRARRMLPARFPQLAIGWVPLRPRGHRIAQLVLADLLPDVDRAVLLPLPAVATADVAELADIDLAGHALAAPRRPAGRGVSGFGLIHAAAARLRDRTAAATALRRTAHARHAFDFDAFTADVLVLDLARLRRDDFSGQALPLLDEFGLDALEALHYLVGPQRATVPERWAVAPTRTPARGDGLIHWPDKVKPWHTELTPERDRWRQYDANLRR
jgi:hypothetical protein